MRGGRVPSPEPRGRTGGSTRTTGERRVDQADYARDAKKEEAMCAYGGCMNSHDMKKAPKGYRGRYGGRHLCPNHYQIIVDALLASLEEHGCAPWEK